MVTTIEMMRKWWIRAAFTAPSAAPTPMAATKPSNQLPPTAPNIVASTYCTTEAATANEMSIPPAISTTSRPTAQITFTAELFKSDVTLTSVAKFGVATDRAPHSSTSTRSSRISVG